MKPEAFDACFTIGVGPAGEPVERPVRQMTADEFLTAWAWHQRAAARFEEEGAAVLDLLSDKAEAGRLTRVERRAYRMGVDLMRAAGVEHHKTGQLMRLACILMPQWVRQPQVTVSDAVRQWWPDRMNEFCHMTLSRGRGRVSDRRLGRVPAVQLPVRVRELAVSDDLLMRLNRSPQCPPW